MKWGGRKQINTVENDFFWVSISVFYEIYVISAALSKVVLYGPTKELCYYF